ncbi:MAG: tetratricopeptide repeat protein [Candidatus Njordarchaeia archaeon]
MEGSNFKSSWYSALRRMDGVELEKLIKEFRDAPEVQLYVRGIELIGLLERFRESDDSIMDSARIFITGRKIVELFFDHRDLLEHPENFPFFSYLVKANFLYSVVEIVEMINLEKFSVEERARVYVDKGIALYRLGIYSDAVASLSSALEFEETREIATLYTFLSLIEENVGSGKRFYKEKAGEMREETRLNCEAVIKFFDGKYEEAIRDLDDLWEKSGLYSELIRYMGMAYEKLGRYKEARKLYLASFYSNYGVYMDALISYVRLLMKLGEYKLAEFCARIGINLGDNTDTISLYEMDLLRRLKKNKTLREVFKERLAVFFPELDFWGKALREIFKKENVAEFLKNVEDKPEAVIYALWILQAEKDYETAEKVLLRIIEAGKISGEWMARAYEGLGLIEKGRKNFEVSLNYIEKGLEIIPDDNELLLLKIKNLITLGRLGEAYETLNILQKNLHNKEIRKEMKKLSKKLKKMLKS